MKVLFIKNLILTNGERDYNYQRMKVYNLPESVASELIDQGYCVKFGIWGSELENKSKTNGKGGADDERL